MSVDTTRLPIMVFAVDSMSPFRPRLAMVVIFMHFVLTTVEIYNRKLITMNALSRLK